MACLLQIINGIIYQCKRGVKTMEPENRNKKYVIAGITAFVIVLVLVAIIWFVFTSTTAALPKDVRTKLETLEALVTLDELNSEDVIVAETLIEETQSLSRDLNSNQQTVVGNELSRLTKILQKHIAVLEQDTLKHNAIIYLKEQFNNLKNALALDYASLVIDNLNGINIESARSMYIGTITNRNFEYDGKANIYSMEKDGVVMEVTLSVENTGRYNIGYEIK